MGIKYNTKDHFGFEAAVDVKKLDALSEANIDELAKIFGLEPHEVENLEDEILSITGDE
tara:strand:- start:568 stop:744 length:177 start_codon:yes stop_codon:yes gene_type:complete